MLIVIIISQVSSVSSWAQLFWETDRNQMKWKNESNETGIFGERGKQVSSEKNILEQSREALYHNLHDIKPKIEPEPHCLPQKVEY